MKVFTRIGVRLIAGWIAFFPIGMASGQDLPGQAPPLITEVTDEVQWKSWQNAAFELASQQNKPVLLSIEARWQYESEALRLDGYRNTDFAALINRRFVAVRVDADQRPDLVRRYAPEGIPTVVVLSQNGLPLKNPRTGEIFGGRVADSKPLMALGEAVSRELDRNRWEKLESKLPERWEPTPEKGKVFKDEFVKVLLMDLMEQYDPEFGGFGDPQQGYQKKRPEVDTLRLMLVAGQLWKDSTVADPALHTLKAMSAGSFYQKGFGEVTTRREWKRIHSEKTLRTNMALLELYLEAFQQTQDNYFMEIAYKLQDDTLVFQDMFLRKGFSGAFYSAQRALVEEDVARGLEEGPMIQSLITPWVAQAVRSYFRSTEMTNELRWRKLALRTLDFMTAEMVSDASHVVYSLDRSERGLDGLFEAYPALAEALLDAFQRTSDRNFLSQAERVMQVAEELFWQDSGYYSDVVVGEDAIGLLKQPAVDLRANAKAIEILLQLQVFTGREGYRSRAKQVLDMLAPEALKGGTGSAAFGLAVLRFIHAPVQVTIVGSKAHTQTGALRDRALVLRHPYVLVEVIDPESDSERLKQLGFGVGEQPQAFMHLDMLQAPPISDPEKLKDALESVLGQ